MLRILMLLLALAAALPAMAQTRENPYEWDGNKYIPSTGSRDRFRLYWNGLNWVPLPSLNDEEKITKEQNRCIGDKISKMKTGEAIRLLIAGCEYLSRSSVYLDQKSNKEWLIGQCIISRTSGMEPDGAANLIHSVCHQEAENPSLLQKMELCVARKQCL